MDQINTKEYFQTKKKKENYHRILQIQINLDCKFQIQQFWFLEQISKKKILPVKNTKNEHRYWILHIRISLSTNFRLKLTIAIFWIKFAKKGSYFQFKTGKIDTTIEFCIFELVFVSNFTLNKQFWIFGPNLPKKDIYVQKQKKWTSSLNSAYSN